MINETTNALCGVAAATFFIANCLSTQRVDPGHYVSPWKTPWTYEGMRGADHWSVLDTAYAACNRGTAQSPVDIQHPEMPDLPPLRFENHSAPLTHVINNGHTIRVNYYAPGSGDFLTVGSARYQLIQFHFHRPSEELVCGQSYPMVAHLMYQTTRGQAAGVAVLLVAGRANSTVQRVWDRMPIHEGQEDVQAQIAAFARLYPMNARPVQALNDRVVRETR